MNSRHAPEISSASRPPTSGKHGGVGDDAHLDAASRTRWESVLGRDLGSVRVRTDLEADRIASGNDAMAFSIGSTIGFRSGAYRSGTLEGEALIAHELAHVAQQDARRPIDQHSLVQALAIENDAHNWAIAAMERPLLGGPEPRSKEHL